MLYYVGRKDPDEVLDFPLEWKDWLAGASITSATIADFTAGITATVSTSDTLTVVRFVGGADGNLYRATVRVARTGGETAEHSLLVRVAHSHALSLPTGADVVELLPSDTAITPGEAQGRIDEAAGLLSGNHGGALPVTERTLALLERYAHAYSLKDHYMKGEAYLDTPGVDKYIDRVEAQFEKYDEENSTEAEVRAEAPVARIGRVPWSR